MLPPVLLDQWWLSFPSVMCIFFGGIGPMVMAVVWIHLGFWHTPGPAGVKQFLSSCFSFSRLTARHLLITAGCILWIVLIPLVLDPQQRLSAEILSTGPGIFFIVGLIFGALEEIGWRGYAQRAFQGVLSVWKASLVIGIFWALWHLPLFFIEGTYQHQLAPGSAAFWAFLCALPAASIVYGWLYHITGGSAAAPILYHGLGNVVREMVTDAQPFYAFIGECALAMLVMIISWSLMTRKTAG